MAPCKPFSTASIRYASIVMSCVAEEKATNRAASATIITSERDAGMIPISVRPPSTGRTPASNADNGGGPNVAMGLMAAMASKPRAIPHCAGSIQPRRRPRSRVSSGKGKRSTTGAQKTLIE